MPENFSSSARIVFCDSGLGGIDVAAGFIAAIRRYCRVKELEIICFNAWPRPGVGFNQLPDLATKLAVLRQVNAAIAALRPTLVVYACNTLSTLIADGKVPLPFPAVTMLDTVTTLLTQALKTIPDTNLLICGTATTVTSRLYSRRLAGLGFDGSRFTELGCPGLATQIEYAPDGAVVRHMIGTYSRQAAELFPGGKLLLGLCCTHFGYTSFWQEAFARFFDEVTLINPNAGIAERLLPAWRGNYQPHIRAKLLTRVDISRQKRAAIAPLIVRRSPELAQALSAPLRDQALFTF